MADMDVAVGVGRPVVEHEFFPPLAGGAQPPVEVELAPARQDFRLLVRQLARIGKSVLGKNSVWL